MSGKEGIMMLNTGLVHAGGTSISGSDREVVDLAGWGTFRSSEHVLV